MHSSQILKVLLVLAAAAAVVLTVVVIVSGPARTVRPPPIAPSTDVPARQEPAPAGGRPSRAAPTPETEAQAPPAVQPRTRTPLPPRLTITGRILEPDGTPARRVSLEAALAASEPVRLTGSGPAIAAHSSFAGTEDDGTFVVEGLLPGLYDLTAIHESGRADRRVRAGARDVAVVLRDGLEIQGTVTFPDGEPAPSVEVRAVGSSGHGRAVTAKTDEAGAFRVWPLDPGVYIVEAAGSAIQDTVDDVVRAGDESLAIVAERAILLRGRVLSSDGGPIGGSIPVEVSRAGDKQRRSGTPARRSTTDEHGRFEVLCPWPGPYRIATEASPPHPGATVEPVDPTRGEVIVRLGAAALLEVTVEDARTGRPIEEAETRVLVRPEKIRVGHGPTARFALAESGPATVEARAAGYFAGRQEAALSPGEPARLAFTLEPAGSLSGTVRSEDGTPVEGARVSLARQIGPGTRVGGEVERAVASGLFGGPAWTDAEGAFRLSLEKTRAGLAYGFVVEHPDVFLEDNVTMEVADPAEDSRGVEIAVRRAGRITGTIRDGDGPVRGAAVLCFVSRGGYHSETSTGPDGRFEIGGLVPAMFELQAEARGHAPVWTEPMEVGAGSTVVADFHLEAEAAIQGRVTDPAGRPVPGALLRTEWRSGERRSEARTRSDRAGRWRLGSIPAGTYTLRAEKNGFATAVHRDAPANGPAVDLVLAPLSSVEGRVTGLRSGLPVEKFTVRLLPDRADMEIHDELAPREFESGDGAYRLEGVMPGAYRLIIGAAGHIEHESALEVRRGEPAWSDVALDEGSAILGVVLGPGGEPIEGAEVAAALLGGRTPAGRPGLVTTTDAEGRFRLSGLTAGEHRLTVRHPAFEEYRVEPFAVGPSTGPPPEVHVRLGRK